MKPKLWNGPNAMGEALVRGLRFTASPYLSSETADGVTAGVMDGKGEVKFGDKEETELVFTPLRSNNTDTTQFNYAAPFTDEFGVEINPPLGTLYSDTRHYPDGTTRKPTWMYISSSEGSGTISKAHKRVYGCRNWIGKKKSYTLSWAGPSTRSLNITAFSQCVLGGTVGYPTDTLVTRRLSEQIGEWDVTNWVYNDFPDIYVFSKFNVAFNAVDAGLSALTTVNGKETHTFVVAGAAMFKGEDGWVMRVVLVNSHAGGATHKLYEFPTTRGADNQIVVSSYDDPVLLGAYTSPVGAYQVSDWYFSRDGAAAVCTFNAGEIVTVAGWDIDLGFHTVLSSESRMVGTRIETPVTYSSVSGNAGVDGWSGIKSWSYTKSTEYAWSDQIIYADYSKTGLVYAKRKAYTSGDSFSFTGDQYVQATGGNWGAVVDKSSLQTNSYTGSPTVDFEIGGEGFVLSVPKSGIVSTRTAEKEHPNTGTCVNGSWSQTQDTMTTGDLVWVDARYNAAMHLSRRAIIQTTATQACGVAPVTANSTATNVLRIIVGSTHDTVELYSRTTTTSSSTGWSAAPPYVPTPEGVVAVDEAVTNPTVTFQARVTTGAITEVGKKNKRSYIFAVETHPLPLSGEVPPKIFPSPVTTRNLSYWFASAELKKKLDKLFVGATSYLFTDASIV